MKPPYLTIETLLGMIEGQSGVACRRIMDVNRQLFRLVQGSTNNHQNWPGGYQDHVQEVLNLAKVLYEALSVLGRSLDFSLSDALLVMFLHDIEKPWKYELGADGQLHVIPSLVEKEAQHEFRARKLAEYGIDLTPAQQNGLRYVEGEMKDYSSRHRVSLPLAGFCHMVDHCSARVFFAHPFEVDDPWTGASRIR